MTSGREAEYLGADASLRSIRLIGWTLTIALGAMQAWAGRFGIGEDGVSYLDIADAYLRGDWHNALSAYWGPMYSWVMAAALGLVRPTPFGESTLVHAVNFLIYLGALAAFEFMLRSLLAVRRRRAAGTTQPGPVQLPDAALVAIAYGLFAWVSIEWITVPLESPDLILTIFVYLATALLLRMRLRPVGTAHFVALGAVLGLACLTKSAMFPLSVVFLVLVPMVADRRAGVWRGVALAIGTLALVAGPYVGAISVAKQRLTFGDTGRLAYVWFANGATDRELHWSREFPDDRRPVHPTRKVLTRPAIYEFGTDPVAGTYPIWYDPSYWHEGETPHLDLRGQLRVLHWSAEEIWRMLVDEIDFVLFAALVLLITGFTTWQALRRDAFGHVELLIPGLAAVGMYSLVLFSPRYVAVFLLLFGIGIFSTVRLPGSAGMRRLAAATAVGVLLMIALQLSPLTATMLEQIRGQQSPGAHRFFAVAEGLRQLGASPGDKVARIGYGPPAYWARLAGVRIVAEMFSEEPDFTSVPDVDSALHDGALKPEVIQAFARTGARFVIAWKPPADVAQQGWTELGEHTQWFAYRVAP